MNQSYQLPEDEADVLPCQDKLVFDTQREAAASANVVAYRYGSKVYPYRCHHCGLYHLSSQTGD